jgi:hypothetical protein
VGGSGAGGSGDGGSDDGGSGDGGSGEGGSGEGGSVFASGHASERLRWDGRGSYRSRRVQ